MKRNLDSLKRNPDSLKRNLDSLKRNLDSLKRNLDSLKRNLDSLKRNLDFLKRKLDSMPGGGYPRQFSIGMCRQGSQTLTLFKGRKSTIDTLLKAQNPLRETR